MTLPNFVYIGTGKSGSTWLFETLRRHPNVYLAPSKETTFFDLNRHRGVAWYEAFFAGSKGESVVGEIAHRYLQIPDVASSMAEVLGTDIRLMVTFRKPIDFLVSDYRFAIRNGKQPESFERFVIENDRLDAVAYSARLQPFRDTFGDERILVTSFGDLVADMEGMLRRVTDFVGIEPFEEIPTTGRVNPAAFPRSARLARMANAGSKRAKRYGLQRVVARVKRNPVVGRGLYAAASPAAVVTVAPSLKAEADRIARIEAEALDHAFGTSFRVEWLGE
ncbi:MAG: sulfotransferase [Actinomycetota bacterium]